MATTLFESPHANDGFRCAMIAHRSSGDRMGDIERASQHYEAALAAWGRADPDFEPKARAEAGLARVRSVG